MAMISNKDKVAYLQAHIDNLNFHISHVNNTLANIEDYPIPEGKPSINLLGYLEDLTNKKNFYQGQLEAIAHNDEE